MAKIYLIEGPVGSGKSTFAEQLAFETKAPHLNLDTWMANLFGPDRPSSGAMEWYIERKERCIEQIWQVAKEILNSGCNVILELGLIQRSGRQAIYTRAKESDCELLAYVLDAPRDIRRERVRQRNLERGPTFSMAVSDEIFEMASNMWEVPDAIEISQHSIEFIET